MTRASTRPRLHLADYLARWADEPVERWEHVAMMVSNEGNIAGLLRWQGSPTRPTRCSTSSSRRSPS